MREFIICVNNREYEARVISSSARDDLALLSLELQDEVVQPIVLCDSDSLMVGAVKMVPLALLGAGLPIFALVNLFSAVHGAYQHANIPVRLGPLIDSESAAPPRAPL